MEVGRSMCLRVAVAGGLARDKTCENCPSKVLHFTLQIQASICHPSVAQIVLCTSVPADMNSSAPHDQRGFIIISLVNQPSFMARVSDTGSNFEENKLVSHWCIDQKYGQKLLARP